MRQDIEITDFTGGELSPKLRGRTDLKKYFSSLATGRNMVIMPQGGATKRPPTLYVANAKSQTSLNRPKRFVFSTVQAYQLEFSNLNVRIYANDAQVLSGGVPVDVVLPYVVADIPALKFCQSADTLFIYHSSYPPAKLVRNSHISWTYSVLVFRDGPYLPVNTTTTTLAVSAATGSVTVTASAITGINNDTGFQTSDVGRAIRFKLYSLWAWLLITARTDTTHVTATVQLGTEFGGPDAIDGVAWAATTDYVTGAVVSLAGKYYIAVAGGRSAGAGGPTGNGTQIIDGTVTWKLAGGYDSTAWAQATIYDTGVVVLSGSGNYYQCTAAGKSSGAGTGPTGTGSGIADGTATWAYLNPFTFPTTTTDWRLGAWGSALGYPGTGKFWQERLHMAGPISQPNRVDASVVADFTNMAPTAGDGTVTDANALSWILDDDEVNAIRALSPSGSAQSAQLAIFTDGGEHVEQAASAAQALTPTSVQIYRETSYGANANVDPIRIGKVVLFVDRPALKIREFAFYWQANGYLAPDVLQFNDHMSKAPAGLPASQSGIKWWAYQQAPYQVIWAGLNNGKLISITYDRDQQIWAPMQHQLGGNYYGGPPVVEWGDTIPAPDGSYDELWLSVLRTVNGAEVRFMEVMGRYFDNGDPDDAWFADAANTTALNKPAATLTMSGLTQANPPDVLPETVPPSYSGTGTFTASAGTPFNSGMVNNAIIKVNGGKVLVTGYTDPTHVTGQVLRPLLSVAPATSGNWSCTTKLTTVTGLSWLEGENVVLVGDGAYQGEKRVSGGSVSPDTKSSFIAAGLPYTPLLVGMPFEPQRAAAASSQGKLKQIDTLWVRFHESLGCSFGRRMTDSMTEVVYDKVEPLQSRIAADAMDNAPALYSGMRELVPQGSHDREGQFIITQSEPLALTVLGIFARGDVQEMPG